MRRNRRGKAGDEWFPAVWSKAYSEDEDYFIKKGYSTALRARAVPRGSVATPARCPKSSTMHCPEIGWLPGVTRRASSD